MTLGEEDHPKGYLSIRKLYVEHTIDDPTEYTFAMEVFGSWEVWCGIRDSSDPKIQKALASARELASVKRQAIAFRAVMDKVKEGAATFQAERWLVDEPWNDTKPTKDGRKKRKEDAQEAEVTFEKKGLSEDLQRLKDEGYLQ